MNEFRQDPVSGSWVIIAADRDRRPNQFLQTDGGATLGSKKQPEDGSDSCPFCASQMDTPPIVEQYGASDTEEPWQVCVVTNRYPCFEGLESGFDGPPPRGLLKSYPANGRHEVLIESPTHQVRTGDLSKKQFFYMLKGVS